MIAAPRYPLARLRPAIAQLAGPPLWLTIFAVLGGALASITVTRGLFDPDYFWHLAVGQRILETGAIPTAEPFSFTWAGDPWIPDQWLGEVAIAGLASVAGGALLLVAFGLIAASGPALVVAASGRTSQLRALAFAALVAAVLVPQVTARPQVLSFALAGATLAILMSLNAENGRRAWWLPILLAVWANIHGYFIVGLVAVLTFTAFTLAGTTPARRYRARMVGVALACVAATALTPQGPAGLLYAASFMDPTDFGARTISEWQSPDFHSLQFIAFLGLIGVAVVSGVNRAPRWMQVLAVGGICAGLFAARATGIGAILVLPALLAANAPSRLEPRDVGREWLRFGAAVAVGVVAVSAALGRGPVEVDARRVPVAGVEALKAVDRDANVLADYAWGGYVMSELADDGGRVFVDGRMHKYRPDVLADYMRIVGGEPGWHDLVEAYGVEAILLAPDAALAGGIAQDAGWCEQLRTSSEVLLLRSCEGS